MLLISYVIFPLWCHFCFKFVPKRSSLIISIYLEITLLEFFVCYFRKNDRLPSAFLLTQTKHMSCSNPGAYEQNVGSQQNRLGLSEEGETQSRDNFKCFVLFHKGSDQYLVFSFNVQIRHFEMHANYSLRESVE